jgi:hypothetical protein
LNIRDVEVTEKRVTEYAANHGIGNLGHYRRNGMIFLRLNFPKGTYAPFHEEFLLWDSGRLE